MASAGIGNLAFLIGGYVSLPQFSTQNFTGVTATVTGTSGAQPFGNLSSGQINLTDWNYNVIGETSSPGADQASFSITWEGPGFGVPAGKPAGRPA